MLDKKEEKSFIIYIDNEDFFFYSVFNERGKHPKGENRMTKVIISKLDMPLNASGHVLRYNAQLFVNDYYAGYGRFCETLAEAKAYAEQNAESCEIV